MNIYLMRHGETHWNKKGFIQGSSDIELTELGIELAVVTGEGFQKDGITFQRIYTSPYKRAVKTAEIISDKTLTDSRNSQNFIVDERIREMCFGKYEGHSLKELRTMDQNIQDCFTIPSKYVADETGESYEAVYDRIQTFLQDELLTLEEKYSDQNILIVCHGAVIRAFLTLIRHMDLDEFWTIRQPNCCVNLISLKNGEFSSVKENILYYESEDLLNRGIL